MNDVKWTCQLCGEGRENKQSMIRHLKYAHELKRFRTDKNDEITLKGKTLATTKHQWVMNF